MKKRNKQLKKEIVIELKDITKEYILSHSKPTISDIFTLGYQRKKFKALENVNLTIAKGEKIGIVGANGAGKTTLLKIITGIVTPNSGSVNVKGKVVSLIDLSAGFHTDLTGLENIFLNGTVIGMSYSEIQDKFNEIIEFADIGSFINQSLYTYSDGMMLRLGFSIAIHSDPDILIMDEGFSVGDKNFRKKTQQKINSFVKQGKTIILASHWIDYLKENSYKIIVLKNKSIKSLK